MLIGIKRTGKNVETATNIIWRFEKIFHYSADVKFSLDMVARYCNLIEVCIILVMNDEREGAIDKL